MILDHYNSLVHGLFFFTFKKKLYIEIYKKRYNLMENEQDMPFQSEGGCTLDFFINIQYDFEA
jgi:hypothetical protein